MTFAKQVYEVVRTIPKGKVSTYKHIAHAVGSNAYRAVGTILAHNPYAPKVPCHRVVRSDRSLGGFFGCISGPHVERKKSLLLKEGVRFSGDKVDATCMFIPPIK